MNVNAYAQVKIRCRWFARALLFCAPVTRHVPLVRNAFAWLCRRGIYIDGERLDRTRKRLRI